MQSLFLLHSRPTPIPIPIFVTCFWCRNPLDPHQPSFPPLTWLNYSLGGWKLCRTLLSKMYIRPVNSSDKIYWNSKIKVGFNKFCRDSGRILQALAIFFSYFFLAFGVLLHQLSLLIISRCSLARLNSFNNSTSFFFNSSWQVLWCWRKRNSWCFFCQNGVKEYLTPNRRLNIKIFYILYFFF